MDFATLDMKRILIFLSFLCVKTMLFSQDTTEVVRNFIERGLKDYSFCSCLYFTNIKDSSNIKSFLLNEGSISGYVNVLELNFSYFDTLDKLAEKNTRIVYSSKHNKPLLIMKCLDFYNSQELQDSVNSIIERSSEDWTDPESLSTLYYMANNRNKKRK